MSRLFILDLNEVYGGIVIEILCSDNVEKAYYNFDHK